MGKLLYCSNNVTEVKDCTIKRRSSNGSSVSTHSAHKWWTQRHHGELAVVCTAWCVIRWRGRVLFWYIWYSYSIAMVLSSMEGSERITLNICCLYCTEVEQVKLTPQWMKEKKETQKGKCALWSLKRLQKLTVWGLSGQSDHQCYGHYSNQFFEIGKSFFCKTSFLPDVKDVEVKKNDVMYQLLWYIFWSSCTLTIIFICFLRGTCTGNPVWCACCNLMRLLCSYF